MMSETKAKLIGVGAGIALLLFYFGTLTLSNSFEYAVSQFTSMWYWIIALSFGFGIQAYLYTKINTHIKDNKGKVEMATSGGVSMASMVACCAHRLTDVLPIIGVSAASLFLMKYQTFFLAIGLFSNIFGIFMMLKVAKENMAIKGPTWLIKQDFKSLQNITLALAILALPIIFIGATATPVVSQNTANLGTKTNSENSLTIEITPIEFNFYEPIKFDVALNTHQGSLDYDMTKVSILEDAEGNTYQPISWEGSLSGGHHRSGILTFPKLENTDRLELTIYGVYGVEERIFTWAI
ncbi:MAG: hypothetical protein GOU98_01055 [Candidatus Altiarchaeota archaeon]|nr:hypothetical protein [Candidatus Altiarchaeota archaeon]